MKIDYKFRIKLKAKIRKLILKKGGHVLKDLLKEKGRQIDFQDITKRFYFEILGTIDLPSILKEHEDSKWLRIAVSEEDVDLLNTLWAMTETDYRYLVQEILDIRSERQDLSKLKIERRALPYSKCCEISCLINPLTYQKLSKVASTNKTSPEVLISSILHGYLVFLRRKEKKRKQKKKKKSKRKEKKTKQLTISCFS